MTVSERRYLIWSIEHHAWWRSGWMGYTQVLAEAGLYDEREAEEILQRANHVAVNECKIPIESVDIVGFAVELAAALAESVKLQSHYAELLNMHDGGLRVGFANAAAWIARLRETGTLPAVESQR